jgi:hypothetical protein
MANPVQKDFSVIGGITILNSNLTGVATEGSAVEIDTEGKSLAVVQVTGTWTGTLSLQVTVSGDVWVTAGSAATFVNVATRSAGATITTNGIYQFDVSGYTSVRVTATAAMTGTANVLLNATSFALASGLGTPAILSGSALIGDVGGGVRATSGGLSTPNRLTSAAAGNNSTLVKSSAGRVYKITGYNAATTLRFLKLYNKTTAPVVGTDTPVNTFALPPSKDFDIDFGIIGRSFATGIGFGLSTGVADADTGALVAGDILAMNTHFS